MSDTTLAGRPAQPLVIVLLAVPIFVQVIVNSALACGLNRRLGVSHAVPGRRR